jgi:5-oxoprolinase (ATP-hydrolysing)
MILNAHNTETDKKEWQFWVDRGGTFTDVVAKNPRGQLTTKKLLSENPEAYDDAALHAIRLFLGLDKGAPIPHERIRSVKMGTTVATNALLERKGEATVLAITEGLEDSIEIGHQARPLTFALNIEKTELLYDHVIGVRERISADGKINTPVDIEMTRGALALAYSKGYRSIAIVLMHAYKYSEHEKIVAELAVQIGFKQISTSHEVSPLTKIVPRGETTIVDAYLTPILHRYVNRIADAIGSQNEPGKLLFMQSSGGLTDSKKFRGRDAILSGPAGGIIGATHTAKIAGFNKIIGFDMGGTSTDVSHFAGQYEKAYETEVAGIRMRVPMMYIHTVAAGGGSILAYDGNRFRVGPGSAGANPGPVCYRRGGQLAVTDINVCLGKIQPKYFPKIFGPDQDEQLDREATVQAFAKIALKIGDNRTPETVAEGFLDIAIEHMAQAIKKISVSRGYDVKNYVLNCFGGAGGQHACLVAERLGMEKIFLHPLSGVLSAYGMGLADISTERQKVIERGLDSDAMSVAKLELSSLIQKNSEDLIEQGLDEQLIESNLWVLLRYKGTDTTIQVKFDDADSMRRQFETEHMRQYGFMAAEKEIVLETLGVTSFGGGESPPEKPSTHATNTTPLPIDEQQVYSCGEWHNTPIYNIEQLTFGHELSGPAIIIEPTGTIVVEKNWRAIVTPYQHLVLEKTGAIEIINQGSVECDPVRLEIFNNLFMSIAEQMGIVLRNTSQSVNIKERLDFSCAVFDKQGNLVANAPHVPVHLGSMDSSVKVVINSGQEIRPGDVFVQNNPYNGGSHLPDITVITPVFNDDGVQIMFYVASRAHHEDIGGIAPGSMSPLGKNIYEEGVIIDCLKLVDKGTFLHDDIHAVLSSGKYPARNIEQNIADLMAQIAANNTGVNELKKLVTNYSLRTVHAYMGFIQDSAEQAVRKVISGLDDCEFVHEIDSGAVIKVSIKVDKDNKQATIDFTGTSEQQPSNFNAPGAITQAAVLYVFRCLVGDDIPLNAGCMKPLNIIVPEGSMLSPKHPAAVVAGNVETSQAVTNALFGALQALGSSQGTMNNLTFGDDDCQYYETICSGAPAGPGFNGAAAVHTHMTNTRLTDPEILESRYPVMLEEFSIRRKSGGQGKWNAGDGIYRRIRFLKSMECSILSDHRRVPLFGTAGGEVGEIGRNWVERADSRIDELGGCAQTVMSAGDTINISTPTGGGFGLIPKE